MGTFYRKNPTLAALGLQTEIVPPFLVFEAQSRYIANILSRRVALPRNEQEMDENEEKLLVKSEDEYTSPIAKIYKVETEYIIITENSIYLVSSDIPSKRISS